MTDVDDVGRIVKYVSSYLLRKYASIGQLDWDCLIFHVDLTMLNI